MAATEKIKFTGGDTETANNAFLQSIRKNAEIINTKEPATGSGQTCPATAETGSVATDTASTEKVLVNFKMNKANLDRLRAYCRENDMTLTAGIKRAIRQMLDNEHGANR